MKKAEAEILSKEKSHLIIDYIINILSEPAIYSGRMTFGYEKYSNQNMLVLYIYIPEKDLSEKLNLDITFDHCLIFFDKLLNDILDVFLEHETMGPTIFYTIRSMMGRNFSGINIKNVDNSNIEINFNLYSPDFIKIANKYNKRIEEFKKSRNI